MARNQRSKGDAQGARPITQALRQQVREELPEVAQISDRVLQAKDCRGVGLRTVTFELQVHSRHSSRRQSRHQ